ncbi:hypothetical protein GCM10010276_55920 [Streptomyces longisporus]|uniref:Uncharacterized protein n=1 Tax=Streptomyces longisporus TaxID=1948 RepID=A0ABN3MN20_STRLO
MDMRKRNLPESRRHAPVNSVISHHDRLYAVSHGKGENAPRGALCNGAGQWDQTIYHHTHPAHPKANRTTETLVTSLRG